MSALREPDLAAGLRRVDACGHGSSSNSVPFGFKQRPADRGPGEQPGEQQQREVPVAGRCRRAGRRRTGTARPRCSRTCSSWRRPSRRACRPSRSRSRRRSLRRRTRRTPAMLTSSTAIASRRRRSTRRARRRADDRRRDGQSLPAEARVAGSPQQPVRERSAEQPAEHPRDQRPRREAARFRPCSRPSFPAGSAGTR